MFHKASAAPLGALLVPLVMIGFGVALVTFGRRLAQQAFLTGFVCRVCATRRQSWVRCG